jgi:DMSO/TMAO reductase YedYZ molybdopterin-dependent catalytic subunit
MGDDGGKRGLRDRREFIVRAGIGTCIVALGGIWYFGGEHDPRAKQRLSGGRYRLPPGQRLLSSLRPMGGEPGDPRPSSWRLSVHGAVERPFTLSFAELMAMPQTEQRCDVHCVTGWTVFDARFTGVPIATLAERAGVRPEARHVIIEAAHGYTANVRLEEAIARDSMVVHSYDGEPLAEAHGPPVRALIPQLYFWKSAKWLTGLRFATDDEPGYWETRGYHNHADPWREERYG